MQSANTNMQAAPAVRHFVHISLYLVGSTLAGATLAVPFANAEETGRSAAFFYTPAPSATGEAGDDTAVRATQVTLEEGLPVVDLGKRGGIAPIGVPSQSGVVSVTLWDEVVSPSHVPRPPETTQETVMPYSKK